MDYRKLLDWLRTLPVFGKVSSIVIMVLVMLVLLFSSTSCGGTRAVARTTDRGQTTITITTSNPTNVQASPDVDLNINPKN